MARRPTLADLARDYLAKDEHALERLECDVLGGVEVHRSVAHGAVEAEATGFGDRMADRVAEIGGSWGFIAAFTAVLVGWMLLNTDVLAHLGAEFDPYPYVFLNLMLSTLAAVQAPIIMMSQNRAGDRDRLAARTDYEVNLRTELEIMRLHEKIDALASRLDARS